MSMEIWKRISFLYLPRLRTPKKCIISGPGGLKKFVTPHGGVVNFRSPLNTCISYEYFVRNFFFFFRLRNLLIPVLNEINFRFLFPILDKSHEPTLECCDNDTKLLFVHIRLIIRVVQFQFSSCNERVTARPRQCVKSAFRGFGKPFREWRFLSRQPAAHSFCRFTR